MKFFMALLLLASTGFAQEHAPTPEQCRADYRLWTANNPDLKSLSFEELMQRSHVMDECSTTDPAMMQTFLQDSLRLGKNAPLSYSEVATLFHAVAGDKAVDFLMRHHLMDQFMREEAAGKH
jgi:hypothetical protein